MADWGFLTNHAHVLLCIAREPDTRLRHIADCVGITERATHRIVSDLIEGGFLTRHRLGRRSFYEVHAELPLRDPLGNGHQVGDIFRTLLRTEESASSGPAAPNGHVTAAS